MKQDYLNQMAKKIRNKLILFIHIELKKKYQNNKHSLMINSMTHKELNNKYQKCSDYCVQKVETYSSCEMNNGNSNNNYFHISVTYCSANNNYHMLIDNKNIEQMIGENNIVGKYYKGNNINIRTTTNSKNYNINEIDNEYKLKKMEIGDKKFNKRKKVFCSSLNIPKATILTNDNFANNLNSNRNNNYKDLINTNNNNEMNKKVQTNCINKTKKPKNSNLVGIYTSKLKKYCSNLKILKKKETNSHKKQLKLDITPINEHKKNFKKERNYTIKCEKEPSKILASVINKDYHHKFKTEKKYSNNSNSNRNAPGFKLKSQTKINQNLFIIPEKKMIHRKKRAKSISLTDGKIIFPKKQSPKKISSPKKKTSPKDIVSPKHNHSIHSPKKMINSLAIYSDDKFSSLIHKYKKKNRDNDNNNVKKFISGGIDNKRKMFNANNVNYKNMKINGVVILNSFKINVRLNKKIENKRYKRANTGINKIYNFRGIDTKKKLKDNEK